MATLKPTDGLHGGQQRAELTQTRKALPPEGHTSTGPPLATAAAAAAAAVVARGRMRPARRPGKSPSLRTEFTPKAVQPQGQRARKGCSDKTVTGSARLQADTVCPSHCLLSSHCITPATVEESAPFARHRVASALPLGSAQVFAQLFTTY